MAHEPVQPIGPGRTDTAHRRLPPREFPREKADGVGVERDVVIRARDGVELRADVYHPLGWEGHSWPALLAVSAYQKATAGLPVVPAYPFRETGPIEWYVRRGYVYVLADVRGTGTSGGEWALHSEAEQHDLYDMIEWIAEQPWSSRKVGMIGQSYYGLIQWLAAAQQPPHLTCIAPYDALVDHYRDSLLHGGIPCTFGADWDRVLRANHAWGPASGKPLRFAANPVDAVLEHPLDDEFWEERRAFDRLRSVTVPVLSVGNWGKNSLHVRGNVLGYEQVRGPKKLRMQAAASVPALTVNQALLDFESLELHEKVLAPWFDYWLRGIDNGVLDSPDVTVHVSGVEEERSFSAWPPAEATPTPFYLAAGTREPRYSLNDGALLPAPAEGGDGATAYAYPDPLWHLGTATVTSLGIPNPISRILAFSTAPLAEDLEVVGWPRLAVWASSDQDDTDFIVKVDDVAPRPENLAPELPTPFRTVSKGWLRASHRELDEERSTDHRPHHTHRREQPLTHGQAYLFDIELMPLAHVFRAGHQVRVTISNGDSPVSDAPFTHFYGLKLGTDTIHHGPAHPSRLVLPVIKGGRHGH